MLNIFIRLSLDYTFYASDKLHVTQIPQGLTASFRVICLTSLELETDCLGDYGFNLKFACGNELLKDAIVESAWCGQGYWIL